MPDDVTPPAELPPRQVPPLPSHVNVPAMASALRDAWALELGAPPSAEALAVVLCQWALETGCGSAMICFNVGNFKRPHPAPGQLWTEFSTFEYVNHQRVEIHPPNNYGCRFAAYETLEEGCKAYLHAMRTRWSAAWPAVLAGNVGDFAKALSSAGYYTAPVTAYFRGLMGHWPAMLAAAQKALADAAAAAVTIDTASTLPPAANDTPTPVPDPPAVLLPDVTPDEPNTPDDPEEPT